MKINFRFAMILTAGLMLAAINLPAADAAEEQQLIGVLQGNATPEQKDNACQRLKRIGSAQAVPALAALLADEQLSHSARYALESMPWPAAGQALTAALDKTLGITRAGVIQSLGNRREAGAVPALEKQLNDAHAEVAIAAAWALGKVGNRPAAEALQAAWPKSAGKLRDALNTALLTAGNQLVADGNAQTASGLFKSLYDSKEAGAMRQAAYCGMIRAAGTGGLKLMADGLRSTDGPTQLAALQMARETKMPGANRALVDALPKLTPVAQIALLEILQQRQAREAARGVAALAAGPEAEVRVAALAALGIIGDEQSVPALLAGATSANGAEQKAARQALLVVGGKSTETLIAALAQAKPAAQMEIVRALAGRGEKSTADRLLAFAANGQEATRAAALRAAAQLAGPEHVGALVKLVVDATSENLRTEGREALAAVGRRAQGKAINPEPIVGALGRAPLDARLALWPVCSELKDAKVRDALRAGVRSAEARERTAAIRAMCETRDAELLADLQALAQSAPEPALRTLAVRGAVRLATEDEAAAWPGARRVAVLRQVFGVAGRIEEKRQILAKLGGIAEADALKMAGELFADKELSGEAAQAAVQIAGAIAGAHPQVVVATMKEVQAKDTDAARKQAAAQIVQKIEAMVDFLTAWQVAGPYEQAGKNYSELFDIVFPPETPGAKGVTWKNLPAGAAPAQPYLLDLLKALGGEQRVAYARTAVYAEQDQPARLELGSDDGVKVWLNGKLVHANNIARPTTVGSDKANVQLKQGWNTILLKVTQNNLGWEFCARFVKPDGSRLAGLKCDPAKAQAE